MNSFVIGSGAIPDGRQEELTFPISSVYKCHVSSVMCDYRGSSQLFENT